MGLFVAHVSSLAAATDCVPASGDCDEPTSMKVSMLQKKQINEHTHEGELVSSLEDRKAKILAELESVNSQMADKMTEEELNVIEEEMRSKWTTCDVNDIVSHGMKASYFVFNKEHDEYLSTDGRNADLYHSKGSHSVWHFYPVGGHVNNRFYIKSDKGGFLSSSGDFNHDNVELFSGPGYDSHRELQWLVFAADELTAHAPMCTFYIMHSESHKWLDTHGDNVHIWGDHSDIFELGDAPTNMQWALQSAAGGRW